MNNIKTDEKLYIFMLISYINYVTPNNAKPLQLFTNKTNGYIEQSNRNKYLTLAPTDKSRQKLNKHEKLWRKMKDLTRSINK